MSSQYVHHDDIPTRTPKNIRNWGYEFDWTKLQEKVFAHFPELVETYRLSTWVGSEADSPDDPDDGRFEGAEQARFRFALFPTKFIVAIEDVTPRQLDFGPSTEEGFAFGRINDFIEDVCIECKASGCEVKFEDFCATFIFDRRIKADVNYSAIFE